MSSVERDPPLLIKICTQYKASNTNDHGTGITELFRDKTGRICRTGRGQTGGHLDGTSDTFIMSSHDFIRDIVILNDFDGHLHLFQVITGP